MKYFRLAGTQYRNTSDLTDHSEEIAEAVSKVNPFVSVEVTKSYFTTVPDLTKRESIAVSMILRQGEMGEYTVFRPCLFSSTSTLTKEEIAELEEQKEHGDNREQQKMGGRCRNSGKVPAHKQKSNKKARKGKS